MSAVPHRRQETLLQSRNAPHPDLLRGLNLFERVPSEAQAAVSAALPILPFLDEIGRTIEDNPVTIVSAETGSGKSTQVPKILMQRGHTVVATQPTRLSTFSVARRVAAELGEALGERVGARTALQRCDGPETRLLYCTDGLALVKEQSSHFSDRHILVVDEVHQFSLNIELLLAWAKQQHFHLVLMSATADTRELSNFYGKAPIIQIPGRQHQIKDMTVGTGMEMEKVALSHLKRGESGIIFVPGKREIELTIMRLKELKARAEIFPLHADLLPIEQDACLAPTSRPKCIVATNVAESSVTVPDLDFVIDSGLERCVKIRSGVSGLYVSAISLAQRAQRRGRCGRTGPGCYYDFCPVPMKKRWAYPEPEISRSFLDQAILRAACLGFDMERMSFVHQPPRPQIRQDKKLLERLECVDKRFQVTDLGHQVAKLPASCRTARMLLKAEERGVSDDLITLAALLEVGGIQNNRSDKWLDFAGDERDSDVIAQGWLFAEACKVIARQDLSPEERKQELETLGLVPRLCFKALETRHHLKDMYETYLGQPSSSGSRRDILISLLAGQIDQLFAWDPARQGYLPVLDPQGAAPRRLSKYSVLQEEEPPWLIAGQPFDLQVGSNGQRVILPLIEHTTRATDLQLLREAAPTFVTAREPAPGSKAARRRKLEIYLDGCLLGRCDSQLSPSP